MKRVLFHDKQLADLDEMWAIGNTAWENIQEVLESFLFSGFVVFSGFNIFERAVPDGGVRFGQSLGLQNGRALNIGSTQNINVLSNIGGWGTHKAAHGSLNRYSIIVVKYDTQHTTLVEKWFLDDTDPLSPVEYQQTVNTRVEDYYEIDVIHGSDAGTPAVPATPADFVKIAEIFIAGGATTIIDDNINIVAPPAITNFVDHVTNYDDPHLYEDVSSSTDWVGVKYKLVVDEGAAFFEVVES